MLWCNFFYYYFYYMRSHHLGYIFMVTGYLELGLTDTCNIDMCKKVI